MAEDTVHLYLDGRYLRSVTREEYDEAAAIADPLRSVMDKQIAAVCDALDAETSDASLPR